MKFFRNQSPVDSILATFNSTLSALVAEEVGE